MTNLKLVTDKQTKPKRNKTFEKYMNRINDKKTPWSETDIKYFRKAVGSCSSLPLELRKQLWEAFNNQETIEYKITKEQSATGIEYLKRKAFKANGQPRNTKDYQYGERELHIIKTTKGRQAVQTGLTTLQQGGEKSWT